MNPLARISGLLFLFLLPLIDVSAIEVEVLKEDKKHVRTWNDFVDDLLSFHKKRLKNHDYKIVKSIGGYANHPEFFVQEDFIDKKTGKLLSRLQWERESPDDIHTIEVNVYDDNGRLIRDYSASYLPRYRNAPSQTLIFVHQYNNDLHGFRSFDASGERIFERCQGNWKGEPVSLMLDEDALEEERYQKREFNKGVMATEVYRACFGELAEEADLYLVPN